MSWSKVKNKENIQLREVAEPRAECRGVSLLLFRALGLVCLHIRRKVSSRRPPGSNQVDSKFFPGLRGNCFNLEFAQASGKLIVTGSTRMWIYSARGYPPFCAASQLHLHKINCMRMRGGAGAISHLESPARSLPWFCPLGMLHYVVISCHMSSFSTRQALWGSAIPTAHTLRWLINIGRIDK